MSQTRVAPPISHKSTLPKRRRRRFLPSWKLVASVFAFAILAVVGVVAFGYVTTEIPTPNAFALQQSTTYYYADGTTPITSEGEQNRVIVPLSRVPQHVQRAVIAAENRSFYEDSGISPTGIARAAYNNVRGTSGTQGGSTITQQYAKNYYLTQERSWERKIREIFLSVKLDRQYTKDQILQDYLNTIYFGRGAYGIQAAAQTYFGVDVDQLTVDQGAVLAQVIRAPSYYDPETDPQRAEARFRYVLNGMAEQGWLGGVDPATVPFPAIRTKAESKGPDSAARPGTCGRRPDATCSPRARSPRRTCSRAATRSSRRSRSPSRTRRSRRSRARSTSCRSIPPTSTARSRPFGRATVRSSRRTAAMTSSPRATTTRSRGPSRPGPRSSPSRLLLRWRAASA